MRSLLAHVRAFWRGLRRPSQVDADMSDEMRFHIEMEAQRLQQRGLSVDEATRQAAIAFGGVEKYRGAGRDAFGFTWMRGMSIDFKLGFRMLAEVSGPHSRRALRVVARHRRRCGLSRIRQRPVARQAPLP